MWDVKANFCGCLVTAVFKLMNELADTQANKAIKEDDIEGKGTLVREITALVNKRHVRNGNSFGIK